MPIEGVVADANALLSAAVGKAALRVFTEFDVTVHVSEFNAAELLEYIPVLAAKYLLRVELVELQWRLLPVKLHPFDDYSELYDDALADLAKRDPEDAHPLALARKLQLPIWSNDRDLANLGVECYSTAHLLALLEKQGNP
ncbi:MAG: PIN domain-containing protein [Planctomycetota bacterium]